jgi:hypothetical protein
MNEIPVLILLSMFVQIFLCKPKDNIIKLFDMHKNGIKNHREKIELIK